MLDNSNCNIDRQNCQRAAKPPHLSGDSEEAGSTSDLWASMMARLDRVKQSRLNSSRSLWVYTEDKLNHKDE